MESKRLTVKVGNRELIFETGKIARQANGAVLVQQGETVLFTTACASPEPAPGVDFFPLRVDYQEKFSAAGKTLGGFLKREGRPSERETLISRLIDRPLRPMFEEGYCNEVQVLSYVWSYDGLNTTEPLAICGASAALTLSDIPLIKPVGAVRVGYIDHQYVLNPSTEEMKHSSLDLVLAGTEQGILMIEGFCHFLTEEQVLVAMEEGHKAIREICRALSSWQGQLGKPKRRGVLRVIPEKTLERVRTEAGPALEKAMRSPKKLEREGALQQVHLDVLEKVVKADEEEFSLSHVKSAYKQVSSECMRRMALSEGQRADGRGLCDIRDIFIEPAPLPRTHGSCLFTRGETQTMAVCTLGGENMGQRFETLDEDGLRRFYLQYSFPPFSVGEVGRVGSPGRREIGHGKLAERALQAVLPSEKHFPYTVRLESNITESNGSSSMASVCGGCLAMMDAGIPIERPVAGIAMGLVLEGERYVILSDILGLEDALGDMDFKVTGDAHGITAFQMDIKVEGITMEIMRAALEQAKEGRVYILQKMLAVLPKSRSERSRYAPCIETVQVKASKIGTIIGPGGKQIRAITEASGAEVNINDAGIVSISAASSESMEIAKKMILDLVAEVEVNKVYTGRVTSVMPFGALVEVLPGKIGLCHISQLDKEHVADIHSFVKEGELMTVKVMEITDRGQYKLSRKVLI